MTDFASRSRRLGTAVLSDAAFRTQAGLRVPSAGLRPLIRGSVLVGPAVTVEANNDLVSILEAVDGAQPGDVVVISNTTGSPALIGDLIGAEAVRKGLEGFVIDGYVRDVVALAELGVKVMSRGAFPVGPLKLANGEKQLGAVGVPITVGGAAVAPGDWICGDADGVIVLDQAAITEVISAAEDADRKEAELSRATLDGQSLAESLRLHEFLAKRKDDPEADFNQHVSDGDTAI